jgi:hypothetical protein
MLSVLRSKRRQLRCPQLRIIPLFCRFCLTLHRILSHTISFLAQEFRQTFEAGPKQSQYLGFAGHWVTDTSIMRSEQKDDAHTKKGRNDNEQSTIQDYSIEDRQM